MSAADDACLCRPAQLILRQITTLTTAGPLGHEEYTHDKLSVGDLLDNVTDTFNGEISMPRG